MWATQKLEKDEKIMNDALTKRDITPVLKHRNNTI